MRKIELTTLEDLPVKVESIKSSLERIYGVKLGMEFKVLPVKSLCPTEDFLEKDKLAMILMKIIDEGYRVPIITVRKGGEYYVVDGHHRAYILTKMMKETVESYVLRFPEEVSYRAPQKRAIETLPIIDPAPIDDPILKAWSQIITLLKYYEAMYGLPFYIIVENVPLEKLVPTQPQVSGEQVRSIERLLVPIVCIKYGGKYYILDGHARALRAKEMNLETIRAILLTPKKDLEYGIIRTVNRLGLKGIDDIKVCGEEYAKLCM
ncbi:MAG: ParB N-terminal domain-containing protein [Candidatus Bathyarchaeia archaeon]